MEMEQKNHEGPPFQRMEAPAPTPNDFSYSALCCPSALACVCASVFPLCWCCCTTVTERQEVVMLNYGKYTTTVKEPGCYVYNCCGMEQRIISTARVSIDLANVKVADKRGNPLLISGVVTYELRNARKAALDVVDVKTYIQTQGLTVMKRIASMYPYEGKKDEASLKTEAKHISEQMVQLLQERCLAAGALIVNFELTDLAYAPEIAPAMLIRQQAEVMLDARKIIVEGAVGICNDAVLELKQKGFQLEPHEQARLISNLLITICSEAGVQPTINLNGSDSVHQRHQGGNAAGNAFANANANVNISDIVGSLP